MAKQYTVLDFDGTLYKKDSLIAFHLFCVKKNPFVLCWFPFQVIAFLLHSARLFSTQRFKNWYLLYFSFYKPQKIQQLSMLFWEKEFPEQFNSILLDTIKESTYPVAIITASPVIYIETLMHHFPSVTLIGTPLKYHSGFYKINGKNCKGVEKVRRFYNHFGNDAEVAVMYSDSLCDQPLFNLAARSFLIKSNVITLLD